MIKIMVVEDDIDLNRFVSSSLRNAGYEVFSCFNGLEALENDIQSNALNFTRFICICASPIVYKGADKVSLMFTVPNRPGMLFGVISRLASAGINMTKIESRPIPGTDFEFMFYVDIDADPESQRLVDVLKTLSSALEQFKVLGGYSEVSAK